MNKMCLSVVVMTPGPKTPEAAMRLRQGAKIRELREFHKLSQQQLAVEVGVTKAAVSEWERGISSPRQHLQVRIAKTLMTPWSILFAPVEAA